jgi:GT2 family glycosyltransferase
MKSVIGQPPQKPSTGVSVKESDPDARAVRRLVSSPLFDAEWYASLAGCSADREEAARHYLGEAAETGLSPHPLFDRRWFSDQLTSEETDDPFLVYLRRARSPKWSPHPLFEARRYAKAHPEATEHPHGILAHYLQHGAAAGARPNGWYVPDPSTEPGGLADWVRARQAEARARTSLADELQVAPATTKQPGPSPEPETAAAAGPGMDTGDPAPPKVTVAVVIGARVSYANTMVQSVLAQTVQDWEMLVIRPAEHSDEEVREVIGAVAADPRVTVVEQHGPGTARALNDAIGLASGTYLSWLQSGDEWEPRYLERALAAMTEQPGVQAVTSTVSIRRAPAARDADKIPSTTTFAATPLTREALVAGLDPRLSSLVLRRTLAVELEGFDESLPRDAVTDLLFKVLSRTDVAFVPEVGVRTFTRRAALDAPRPPRRERPLVDHTQVTSWRDVVVNRGAIDWESMARRASRPGTVSVIIPTYQDWQMTTLAVRRVVASSNATGTDVQVIVLANGCDAETAAILDSLPRRFRRTQVVHTPVNHGFALGNNVALQHAVGDVVVFLNNDTEVQPGWLEPLVSALEDPDVLGAQSLLVFPSGTVQSAGVAFPETGGIPHTLLTGFPVEDAQELATAPFSALTGAALAMRWSDAVAMRGFDPVYRNGMEDVDLCLRLLSSRPGRFVVRPDSVVIHHESKTPGRMAKHLLNRHLLLERWGEMLPRDDVRLWRHAGYDVVSHAIGAGAAGDRRVAAPAPVVVRRPQVEVAEGSPRLRWAIKNPAPAGKEGEIWGDTHFARCLAAALRRLGQQVTIDHRPEFDRASGMHDDVTLLLRGLVPYQPAPGAVNLVWLISHPEEFSRSEAESFDRVLAASVPWAERMSAQWRLRIDPLLQATDPSLFHPDRAPADTGDPVLFVGKSRKVLRPMVRDAVERGLPLSVYGPEWGGLIPRSYVKATSVPHDEVGAAYRAAGLVLNDHWEDMRVDGFLSNRLFDAAASGARVITDDVTGVEGFFGRSVQVARDADDLVRLAQAPDLDSIFGDDEERRSVAARVHAEHSFDARAQQLLDAALDVRRQRADAPLLQAAGGSQPEARRRSR